MISQHGIDLSAIATRPVQGEWSGLDLSATDQLSALIWQVSALSLLLVFLIIGISLVARRSGLSAVAGEAGVGLPAALYAPPRVPSRFMEVAKPRPIDIADAGALLHATLDSLESHVAILDQVGNLVDGNEAWLKSSVGRLWPMLQSGQQAPYEVDGKRRDFMFDSLSHLVAHARHRFKTNYLRKIDDRRRVFEFSATQIRTRGAPHVLVVHEDITEKKEANTRIRELSRRATDIQQDERQRIAREIHDSTSQHLIAISLNLINLRRELAVSGKMSKLLEDIEKSTTDAQQEIRLYSYLLYPSQLERFVSQGRIREFRRDECICRQGEEAHALGVILRGMIEVSSAAPSGKRHVLTHLSSSEIFNLVPLLDHEPVVYDARAHEPSSVLYVPEAVFLAALDHEPQLARDLMHLLSFRSRALSGYISDEMLMPLSTRCARLLLMMAELHGAPRPDGSFLIDLKLSQEQFAEMMGRSRQSVNQELQKLEDAGLIETAYSRFAVRDPVALKAIADDY